MWQVPYSREEGGYGVGLKDEPPLPVSVTSASPHAKVSQNCILRLVYTVGIKILLGVNFSRCQNVEVNFTHLHKFHKLVSCWGFFLPPDPACLLVSGVA